MIKTLLYELQHSSIGHGQQPWLVLMQQRAMSSIPLIQVNGLTSELAEAQKPPALRKPPKSTFGKVGIQKPVKDNQEVLNAHPQWHPFHKHYYNPTQSKPDMVPPVDVEKYSNPDYTGPIRNPNFNPSEKYERFQGFVTAKHAALPAGDNEETMFQEPTDPPRRMELSHAYSRQKRLRMRPFTMPTVGKALLPFCSDINQYTAWQQSKARFTPAQWVKLKHWVRGDFHNRQSISWYAPKPPEKWLPPLQCPTWILASWLVPKVKPIEHYMHFLRGRYIATGDNKHILSWRQGYRMKSAYNKRPLSFLKHKDIPQVLNPYHTSKLLKLGFSQKTWW